VKKLLELKKNWAGPASSIRLYLYLQQAALARSNTEPLPGSISRISHLPQKNLQLLFYF